MTDNNEQDGKAELERDVLSRLEEGKYLPPIHRIKMPTTTTSSARIRWLWALGYPVKDISNGLGIRYQQVRNIVNTEPKRAAREDIPPLTIELLEMEDAVDALLGGALESDFAKAREAEKKANKAAMRAIRESALDEDEVDEITEIIEED